MKSLSVITPKIAKMNVGEVINKVVLLGLSRVSKVYGAPSKGLPLFSFPFYILSYNFSLILCLIFVISAESQLSMEMKETLSSFPSPGINHNDAAQSAQRVRGMSHQLDQVLFCFKWF